MEKGFKEIVRVANSEPEINMSANSYDKFLNKLTKEQRDIDIYKLDDDLIYQHIKALYSFLLEAIPDSEDCGNKCAIMFACQLSKKDMKNFDFNMIFEGTKEGVKTEMIKFNLQEIEKEKIIKTEIMSEYADEGSKKPKRKIKLFINDKEKVLELFKMIKYGVQNDKGIETAQSTAGLLIFLDNMSTLNAETLKLTMENLIVENKETNKNFILNVKRIENDFENIVDPKTSFFGFIKRKH